MKFFVFIFEQNCGLFLKFIFEIYFSLSKFAYWSKIFGFIFEQNFLNKFFNQFLNQFFEQIFDQNRLLVEHFCCYFLTKFWFIIKFFLKNRILVEYLKIFPKKLSNGSELVVISSVWQNCLIDKNKHIRFVVIYSEVHLNPRLIINLR